MLLNLVKNEFYKQKRNFVILLVLAIPIAIAVLLSLDFFIRYESWLLPQGIGKGLTSWQILIKEQRILYFNDFIPIFAALILGALFEYEYKGNYWEFLLTKPIKRSKILLAKYIVAVFYYILMLFINVTSLIIVGKVYKFKEAIPVRFFVIMFFIQLIAGIVIMIIHLFINIKHKNTLISIFIAAVSSILSSSMYYRDMQVSKINPYGFSLYSIVQDRQQIFIICTIAIIVITLGSLVIRKFFNSKETY